MRGPLHTSLVHAHSYSLHVCRCQCVIPTHSIMAGNLNSLTYIAVSLCSSSGVCGLPPSRRWHQRTVWVLLCLSEGESGRRDTEQSCPSVQGECCVRYIHVCTCTVDAYVMLCTLVCTYVLVYTHVCVCTYTLHWNKDAPLIQHTLISP